MRRMRERPIGQQWDTTRNPKKMTDILKERCLKKLEEVEGKQGSPN